MHEAENSQARFERASSQKWFPAASADRGTNLTINYGGPGSPFAQGIPCGFSPLWDVTLAATEQGRVGPASSDCWTCMGTCTSHATDGSGCETYASGAEKYVGEDQGMLG